MIDSTNEQAALSLGKVFLQEEKWNKALNIFIELSKHDSSNPYFYEKIGKCYFSMGSIKNAIINYEIANHLNPMNQNIILKLSGLYFSDGKTTKALEIIDDGLFYYPSFSALWSLNGDVNFKMQKYQEAVTSYKNSINLGDLKVKNYRNIGICYYWIDKYDSSIIYLDSAAKINDEDPLIYFYLGVSLKKLNRNIEAGENLFKSLSLQKGNYMDDTYLQIAENYYSDGDMSKAIKFSKKALKENPDRSDIIFYAATLYDKYYKDKSTAAFYFEKFLRLEKKDSTSVDYAKNRIEDIIGLNYSQKF